MTFKIKWNGSVNNFYIHGSEIKYVKGKKGVYFQNLLFPSGSIIVHWDSATDYTMNRTGLQLPLLRCEKEYNLTIKTKIIPDDSIFIKVSFYNRLGEQIEVKIISVRGGSFVYPKKAYSYTLDLINTGVNTLFFEEILIT